MSANPSAELPEFPHLGSSRNERGRAKRILDTTYEVVDGQVVVTGELHDYWEDGEEHQDIHWYKVVLRAEGTDLTVVDLEVIPLVLPFVECLDAARPAERLVGLSLRRGFIPRASEALGGVEGCTHLLTLLTAMTSAQIPAAYLVGRELVESGAAFKPPGFERIVGVCSGWREGSTVVKLTRAGLPQPARWRSDALPSETTK